MELFEGHCPMEIGCHTHTLHKNKNGGQEATVKVRKRSSQRPRRCAANIFRVAQICVFWSRNGSSENCHGNSFTVATRRKEKTVLLHGKVGRLTPAGTSVAMWKETSRNLVAHHSTLIG